MQVELKSYKLSELLARGEARANADEVIQYGDPKKLAVFAADPFRHDEDYVTRRVLYADGRIAGGEYGYPVEIVADGKIVRCGSGSETFVKENFRKQAVGLEFLTSEGDVVESDKISMGCGIAQRYARLHKMFGFKLFPVRRHIALFKSRAVIEMRLHGSLCNVVSALIDIGLRCWWQLQQWTLAFRLRGVRVREIKRDDDVALRAVADIIANDAHRFREHHTVEWLKWHLTCALHPEGPARLFALERNGRLGAFFMTKRKFYEQASSRGFRNVMLGSVVEWGISVRAKIREADLVTFAALRLRKTRVDAAEVATANASVSNLLRRRMLVKVGESNVGIRVGGKSSLAKFAGWDVPENWRLRPAMCDNGL